MISKLRGFTVIELLIAISVIAILSAVAIPYFVDFVNSNRLTNTATKLFYTIQYARNSAIKQNGTVYVSFDTGKDWCYGVNLGSTCICSNPTTCSLGVVSTPNNNNLTLSATGLTNNSVSFENTHGAAYASPTITFTVTGKTTALSVKVNLLGSSQLCSSTLPGYAACT